MRSETLRMSKRFIAVPLPVVLLALTFVAAMGRAQNAQPPAASPALPKVRTVTAFVRLDRATYRAQVAEALKLLRAAKAALNQAGYEVETIRITTQSFPEFTRGMSAEQALQFFRDYDKLAGQEGFTPDIGSAMSK